RAGDSTTGWCRQVEGARGDGVHGDVECDNPFEVACEPQQAVLVPRDDRCRTTREHRIEVGASNARRGAGVVVDVYVIDGEAQLVRERPAILLLPFHPGTLPSAVERYSTVDRSVHAVTSGSVTKHATPVYTGL